MQLVAAFVEYLITGTVALVWILPLLAAARPHLPSVFQPESWPAEGLAIVLLAVLYVVGLLLDFIAYNVMRPSRKRLRAAQGELNEQYRQLLATTPFPVWDDHAFTWIYAPDLAKTLEAYSTRDRIARGAVLNLWIAAAVYLLVIPSRGEKLSFAAAFIGLSVAAYAAWWRSQGLSRKLKKHAVMNIVTKLTRHGAV